MRQARPEQYKVTTAVPAPRNFAFAPFVIYGNTSAIVQTSNEPVGSVGRFVSSWRSEWRKRVGVDPTQGRQTVHTGFEVRPPHRERFPSVKRSLSQVGSGYFLRSTAADFAAAISSAC